MDPSNHSSKRLSIGTFAGATLAVAVCTVFYNTLVQEYGWNGAIRYIWEGEPYPPAIQALLDSLSNAEQSRLAQAAALNAIEEALERARLDSVDDERTTKAVVQRWAEYYLPQSLEKSLAGHSHALDKLAAQVDAVILEGRHYTTNNQVVQDIKRRKKLLSEEIVVDMEKCDAFVAYYQALHERTEE